MFVFEPNLWPTVFNTYLLVLLGCCPYQVWFWMRIEKRMGIAMYLEINCPLFCVIWYHNTKYYLPHRIKENNIPCRLVSLRITLSHSLWESIRQTLDSFLLYTIQLYLKCKSCLKHREQAFSGIKYFKYFPMPHPINCPLMVKAHFHLHQTTTSVEI